MRWRMVWGWVGAGCWVPAPPAPMCRGWAPGPAAAGGFRKSLGGKSRVTAASSAVLPDRRPAGCSWNCCHREQSPQTPEGRLQISYNTFYRVTGTCSIPGTRWENPGLCFLSPPCSHCSRNGCLPFPRRYFFLWCFLSSPAAVWLVLHILAALASLLVGNGRKNALTLARVLRTESRRKFLYQ